MCLMSCSLWAQKVQWASEVLAFSSQFGVRQYAAHQVLGKPNVLPNLGASPNAWSPKKKSNEEYIQVGFPEPMHIQQIAIAETYHPGSISEIYAYDQQGREHLLNAFEPNLLPIEGRLFRFFFELTEYEVSALKIVLHTKVLSGHFGIDAIGISDSKEPINVEINVTDDISDDYVPLMLEPTVNTPFHELRPLITPDAKTLYFSRRNHPGNVGGINDDEDIWLSERDTLTGQWSESKNMGRPLNNDGPNFISSISADGERMLLLLGNAYYSRNRMTQGVSMSKKNDDGTWSRPVQLKIKNDYNLSPRANYFLADDHQTMIMSIERRDTRGDRDLYVSFLNKDESWSEPVNLGSVVNSASEEGSPFLAEDGKTLFFSSKGFSGYGGYDIYLTRRLDDTWTNWSEPENLGASFNSREDDIFFNFTDNDEYAYFSRGNKENTDIYKVKLPYYQKPDMLSLLGSDINSAEIIVRVVGTVYNAKTREPIEGALEFLKDYDVNDIELVASDLTGYSIVLEEDHIYKIIAKSEGFYNTEDTVDLSGIVESTEVRKDLYLDPIIKNTPVVLNNVYFDFDSDVIRSESFPELNRIVEMLLDNPDLQITIDGHTCTIGTDAYNKDLSFRRARSIANYLSKKGGVMQERLAYNGYGEERPLASNDSEEGREMNRRVEFQLRENEGQVQR
jgi:outer membrane protein OmpA-like peptidoglycan-associated protein